MTTYLITSYRLRLDPVLVSVRTFEDDPDIEIIPEIVEVDKKVVDEKAAIEAVRAYFQKVNE